MNLGRRPTFYETAHASLLEAYLLDFDGNLYGESAAVRFTHRLRPELRFDDVDALVTQIEQDVADTRRVLGFEERP
jgi:riboflavin kinase/FMN adenylyltransferase